MQIVFINYSYKVTSILIYTPTLWKPCTYINTKIVLAIIFGDSDTQTHKTELLEGNN